MATPLVDSGGQSPRTFAVQHQRPRASFLGCSKIAEYELLGKLGEGTFGYEFYLFAHYINFWKS